MTTCLVTGAGGFIGAHAVRELLRAGGTVHAIDRQWEGNAVEEILTPAERTRVNLVSRRIPGARALASLLRSLEVTTIVHLASPLSSSTERRPGLAVDAMVRPQRAVLEAARLAAIPKVVWASSVGVFGKVSDYPRLPIPNDAAHHPLSIYGAAKSFNERLAARYSTVYGLNTVGLRFPMVYGPGRRRGGGLFTSTLIESAALERPCTIADADSRYDWMYVADAARSIALAVASDTTGSRALTVGGQVASVRDAAGILREWFPGAAITLLPGEVNLVADYDCSVAARDIGYRPMYSLRHGLRAAVDFVRQRAGLTPL